MVIIDYQSRIFLSQVLIPHHDGYPWFICPSIHMLTPGPRKLGRRKLVVATNEGAVIIVGQTMIRYHLLFELNSLSYIQSDSHSSGSFFPRQFDGYGFFNAFAHTQQT